MRLRLITGPAGFVTLAEAKANLRVTHADDDARITQMIAAATEEVELRCGRAFGSQTWEQILDAFPTDCILIDFGPLVSVTSITYVDAAGATQTVEAADYALDAATLDGVIRPLEPWPVAAPGANAVTVRFVAGTGVAEGIREAVLALVAYLYEPQGHKGMVLHDGLPASVMALIQSRRRMFI